MRRVLDRGILSGPFAPEARWARGGVRALRRREALPSSLIAGRARSMALGAAGVRAGDEVLVPAYSFVATPLAVLQRRGYPGLRRRRDGTGCLDPAGLAGAITPHTRAIMPVHMHGCAADMPAISSRASAQPAGRRGRGASARRDVRREARGGSRRCRRLFASIEQEPVGRRRRSPGHQRPRPRRGGRLRSATSARISRSTTWVVTTWRGPSTASAPSSRSGSARCIGGTR